MKINITLINSNTNKKINVMIDNRQRIKTTLRVLSENIGETFSFQNIKEIRIKDSGRKIQIGSTYEAAKIYTGMELIVISDTQIEQEIFEGV